MTNLEQSILKEFDKQRITGEQISIIMFKINTEEKKNKFLSYMIENRNILLTFSDVIKEVNKYGIS